MVRLVSPPFAFPVSYPYHYLSRSDTVCYRLFSGEALAYDDMTCCLNNYDDVDARDSMACLIPNSPCSLCLLH